MKSLLITLSFLIIYVSAQGGRGGGAKPREGGPPGMPPPPPHGGGPFANYPGCNISTYPVGVNATSCCPSKPKCFMNKSFDETCKTECPKSLNRSEIMCCWSKCVLTQAGVLKADGTFDADAAIAKLLASTNKTDIWTKTVTDVVTKCVSDGPQLLKEFETKINKTMNCESALAKTIDHCIKRELYLQCPESEKVKSDNCTKLDDFAKACPAFPMGFGHGGKGPSNGGPHEKGPKGPENNKGKGAPQNNKKGSKPPPKTTPPKTTGSVAAKAKTTTKPKSG